MVSRAGDPDFWVADAEAVAAQAAERGGTVVTEPYDAPPSFKQAVLSDPQGERSRSASVMS